MTATIEEDREQVAPEPVDGSPAPLSSRAAWMASAGLASLGAGAIHAAAIGIHAESRPAALAFTLCATLQLGWGGLALVRSNRMVGLLGVLIGVGSFGAWVLAKTTGIGFIEGLDVVEPIQTVDALAAGLAVASAVMAAVAIRSRATTPVASASGRRAAVPRIPMPLVAGVIAAVSVFGMSAAGTHVHSHGEGGDHNHDTAAGATAEHDHGASAVVAPAPYDPKVKRVDLSGVPGVTPEQQAAAEHEVEITLDKLPQWADYKYAEAHGFHSINDGFTGVEHFMNNENMADDIILDPDKPESLVYSTEGGGKRLVAAMYMVKQGTPLTDVPDIGGPLMQWHTHENLCFTAQGKVAGITNADGVCRDGLFKPVPTPMIHVWIEKNPCGPFAALEGIGGGTIADGETRLCDHVHGA